MIRLVLLLLALPLVACGQVAKSQQEAGLTGIYSRAIADFIKSANKRNKASFDTLFIGKRANGQPDDFPDISLPQTIESTHIVMIAPAAAKKSQQERESRIYINLIGWINKSTAQFLFVVFSRGFKHQYDYTLHYSYNKKWKEFELDSLRFEGPPFEK